MRKYHTILLVPALMAPLCAQSLSDRLRDVRKDWDLLLEKGNGKTVRSAAEALLEKEGSSVSRSDYNDMRVLVSVRDYAARACALEGEWEETVKHLEAASASAAENQVAAEATFARIRREHETKMVEWQDAVRKQEDNLQKVNSQEGLTEGQIKYRAQLKTFLEEHRAAIAHSEWSLKEMDALLAQLKKEKEIYKLSLDSWKTFIEREKSEVEEAGGTQAYVGDKLSQVKADDARPLFDRLSYARRLQKLEAGNRNIQLFIRSLVGEPAQESEVPKTVKRKGRKTPKT